MSKKGLTPKQEEKLKQLIDEHNKLCEKFHDRIHELMDEIDAICEPVGISAGRVSTFKNGKEVTIIHLQAFGQTDDEIDREWLQQLWDEDDRM